MGLLREVLQGNRDGHYRLYGRNPTEDITHSKTINWTYLIAHSCGTAAFFPACVCPKLSNNKKYRLIIRKLRQKNMGEFIQTNRYEVKYTGSVIVPYNEYIEFGIEDLRFRVIFTAAKDNQGNNVKRHIDLNIKKDDDSKDYMEINVVNPDKSLLLSSKSALQVATLHGKKLFLKFSITSINTNEDNNEEDKIFYYTWLLEK